jgi:hypothetical protein
MPEEINGKKVFKNIAEGKRFVGKPRKRWLDDVENYLKKMREAGGKITRETYARKLIVKGTRAVQGP